MYNTFSFILDHLSVSQLSVDVMLSLNNLAKESNDNICIFTKNLSPPAVNLRFGVFGLNSIHNVDRGTLVATDLDSAEILIKSQTTANKWFFVNDLEWLHNPTKRDFLKNVEIYRNIKLFTRSESYSQALFNYCNVKPEIISISEMINGVQQRTK